MFNHKVHELRNKSKARALRDYHEQFYKLLSSIVDTRTTEDRMARLESSFLKRIFETSKSEKKKNDNFEDYVI